MNTILLWAMAVTAFIVTIIGGVLLAVLFFYILYRMICSIWERNSAVAQNTKEYLLNKSDFDLYKQDLADWDKRRERQIARCYRCEYRKQKKEGEKDGEFII